ncbi:MAG: ETC complex I subunit [Pseudomonadota bacterium]
MSTARIYKPSKTAMQSGAAKTESWLLELEPSAARKIDPLMGWTSGDAITSGQVAMRFPTKEDAIAYAEKNNLVYSVIEERRRVKTPKAYSDNFAYKRRKPWTH